MKSAVAVCEMHYPAQCGGCPIRRECVDQSPQVLSHERLKDWQEKVNQAAVKFLKERAA